MAWEGTAEAAKTSLGVYHLIPMRVVSATRQGLFGLLWELDIIVGETACKKYEFDFYDWARIKACGLADDAKFSRCEMSVWQRRWVKDPSQREIVRLHACRSSSQEEASPAFPT